MTPEAAALAERLLPDALRMAQAAALRSHLPNLTDELESGALLWLAEACAAYDPTHGTDADAWIRCQVWRRCHDFLRAELRRPTTPLRRSDLIDHRPDHALAQLHYADATANLGPARCWSTNLRRYVEPRSPRLKVDLTRYLDLVCVDGLTPNSAARAIGLVPDGARGDASAHRIWRYALHAVAARLGLDQFAS